MAKKNSEWKKLSLSVHISSDIAGIRRSLLTGWARETGGEANDSNRGGEKKVVPAWGLLWNSWEKIQVKKQSFFFLKPVFNPLRQK